MHAFDVDAYFRWTCSVCIVDGKSMENLRWKKELHSNSSQIYYLFFLTVFGKSLSTTDPQPALTCQGGEAPSLTGVAVKRLIIASGGLVEELL